MFLIYFILFLLLVGFSNFLIQKFKKDKKYNRKFYDFEESTSVVVSIFLLIISFTLINIFCADPVFKDLSEKIEYGKKTAQPWLESSAYKELIQKDTNNVDLLFTFVKSHFDENQEMGPSVRDFNREGTFLFDYYNSWTRSANPHKADMGQLGMALYYYYRNDHTMCRDHLQKVKDTKLKYLNTYLGLQYFYFNETYQAEQCLKREIKQKGDIAGAYRKLVGIYDYEKRFTKITPLVYDKAVTAFIPYDLRKRVYITNYDFSNYFKDFFSQVFSNSNIIGFLGAFLILIIWCLYLVRVNVYSKGKWKSIVFTLVLSSLFVYPVCLLYDTYEYLLGFDLNGNILNDFLYCVFGIGVMEELVKVIPFLIVLKFTKSINEPIDYIMYASFSALGFAFVENFEKFGDGSINIIHSRALTASIAHMIFSSLIAYGLILAKFRYKKKPFLFGMLFFFIAAFAHGFYDFWLLNKIVSDYYIFTFICLLTCILIYSSLINNALNHSLTSSDNLNLNTSKLSADLAAGLIIVFLFEYLCLVYIYGPTIGNREFISSALSGGYLILFLSVRLSNLDILPGEWAPVDFFVGLLPGQVIYGDKKPNYNSLVGQRVSIKLFRKKGILVTLLPVEGEIVKREKISGSTAWLLVKLDNPLPIKSNKEYVLIRAKERLAIIRKGDDTIISLVFIPKLELLDNKSKNIKDFNFIDWAVAN